jgi:hypothetical protein
MNRHFDLRSVSIRTIPRRNEVRSVCAIFGITLRLQVMRKLLKVTEIIISAKFRRSQGTFREHPVNIQTFREHSVNIQGTFREHSGNIQ